MALEFFTGFENQVPPATFVGLIDGAGTNVPAISTSIKANGAASLRASTWDSYIQHNLTSETIKVVHINFYPAAFPSVERDIVRLQKSTAPNQRVTIRLTTGGVVRLSAHDGTTETFSVNGPTLTTGTWNRLEMVADTTNNPWVIDWRVNDADQTQFTKAATGFSMNTFYVGSVGGASGTLDYHFDDIAVYGGSTSDYPPGEFRALPLLPSASGTHNLDASPSSFLFEHNGTSGTALTTGESAAAGRVDDMPLSGSSDYIYVTGTPGGTEYAEILFADSAEVNPQAIRVMEAVRQDVSGTSAYTSRVSDNGTDVTDVQTALNPASATEVFRHKVITAKPSGGEWTEDAINGLRYRFGLTADASPEIRLYGVVVEVAYLPEEAEPEAGPKVFVTQANRATW